MKNFDCADIFPLSTKIANNQITIGDCNLSALAKDFGTPLYLYDRETIQTNIQTLNFLLEEHYPQESVIAYASKAYLSLQFARKLAIEPIELDVVSLAEFRIAEKAGFHPNRIHFHGNNKSDEEIYTAIEKKIHAIVIDNWDEMIVAEKIALNMGKAVRIWLRITPDIQVATHPHIQTAAETSKFGFHIQNSDAERAILYALASPAFELTGLHCHLGSQLFDAEPYALAIQMLMNLCEQCNFIPQEISPGGGWGVNYTHETTPNAPENWVRTISDTLVKICRQNQMPLPRLILEPGRWLAARAGVAIYTTGAKKTDLLGNRILCVDGGLSDNPRFALYQAQYTAKIVNKAINEPCANFRIVGKLCESGDVLIENASLPEPERGDLLIIPVSGAYHLSMASNYNLAPRPAVLWLEGKGAFTVLQTREQPEIHSWWV